MPATQSDVLSLKMVFKVEKEFVTIIDMEILCILLAIEHRYYTRKVRRRQHWRKIEHKSLLRHITNSKKQSGRLVNALHKNEYLPRFWSYQNYKKCTQICWMSHSYFTHSNRNYKYKNAQMCHESFVQTFYLFRIICKFWVVVFRFFFCLTLCKT